MVCRALDAASSGATKRAERARIALDQDTGLRTSHLLHDTMRVAVTAGDYSRDGKCFAGLTVWRWRMLPPVALPSSIVAVARAAAEASKCGMQKDHLQRAGGAVVSIHCKINDLHDL